MKTSPERLRSTFLDSLDQTQSETNLLASLLQKMQLDHPELFDSYVANGIHEKIDEDPLNWDERYFSKQREYAKRNFSLKRLEHLLQVRDRFRQQRRKGFSPALQTAEPQCQTESFTNYTPSNNLRKFIEEGDLLTVRTALRMELKNSRLDSQTMQSALAWANSHIPDLCETYSEKAFTRGIDANRDNWTESYYYTQEVYLDTSFTEERFLHLIEVREHLRQQGVKGFAPVATTAVAQALKPASASSQTTENHSTNPPPPLHKGEMHPVLKAALLIGGAIASLVVLLFTLK